MGLVTNRIVFCVFLFSVSEGEVLMIIIFMIVLNLSLIMTVLTMMRIITVMRRDDDENDKDNAFSDDEDEINDIKTSFPSI